MTRADVIRALQRLTDLYALPRHARDIVTLADAWEREVSRDLDPDAFHQAISDYIQHSGEPYFPKLGQLCARAWRIQKARPRFNGSAPATPRTAYLAWEEDWGREEVTLESGLKELAFTACPVCGVVPVTSPRIRVVHQVAAHRDAGIPCIGWTDEAVAMYGRAAPCDEPTHDPAARRAGILERIERYEQRLKTEADPDNRRLIHQSITAWQGALEAPMERLEVTA